MHRPPYHIHLLYSGSAWKQKAKNSSLFCSLSCYKHQQNIRLQMHPHARWYDSRESFKSPLTCHLSLSSRSSPRTTTTIGCHLSTSSRCDCQDDFSLSKRLCVLTNKRVPFKPICLSGWGWDSGPIGGAYSPLIRGLGLKRSCETQAVKHGLAGAGLTAEARRWWKFSSCTVFSKYCNRRASEIMVKWLQQGRGQPKGPKPINRARDLFILSLSLCHHVR